RQRLRRRQPQVTAAMAAPCASPHLPSGSFELSGVPVHLSCRIERMTARRILAPMLVVALAAALSGAQYERGPRRWAQYEREMQDPVPDPPDAWENTEFAVGRLRFHSPFDGFRRHRWGVDANKGDRLFSQILRRLTRIHVRSVEQIVDIDSD